MKKLTKEIKSYTVFGVLTTILSILTYKFFLYINIYYVISTTLSTVIAVIFAYLTNRKYVFKSSNHIFQESIRFFVARIIVFILETFMLIASVSYLEFDEFYSKIAVTIFVVMINYTLSKFVIFRKLKRRIIH